MVEELLVWSEIKAEFLSMFEENDPSTVNL